MDFDIEFEVGKGLCPVSKNGEQLHFAILNHPAKSLFCLIFF